MRWNLVDAAVGNPEAPSQIDMGNGMAPLAQRQEEFRNALIGQGKGLEPRDLAADMDVDAANLDAWHSGRLGVDGRSCSIRDTEFVRGPAG